MHILERETRQTSDEIGFEVELHKRPIVTQPKQCLRCHGLVVNDQEWRVLWRCVNCGCRGENWRVYGMVIGYDTRINREPQIPQAQAQRYREGYITHEQDYDEDDA